MMIIITHAARDFSAALIAFACVLFFTNIVHYAQIDYAQVAGGLLLGAGIGGMILTTGLIGGWIKFADRWSEAGEGQRRVQHK